MPHIPYSNLLHKKFCVWKTFIKPFFLYIIYAWTVHLEGMLPSLGPYSFKLFSTIIYLLFQLTNNTKGFWRTRRGLAGLQSVAFLKLICCLTHLWGELAHFGAKNIICFSNLKISSGLLSAPSSLQYCWLSVWATVPPSTCSIRQSSISTQVPCVPFWN